MKLAKLEFTFFCGASWNFKDVEIIAESKDQCLLMLLAETSAIHLEMSLKSGAQYPRELISQMQQGSIFSPTKDFLVFSSDPGKYIDLNFEEIELPLVIVK